MGRGFVVRLQLGRKDVNFVLQQRNECTCNMHINKKYILVTYSSLLIVRDWYPGLSCLRGVDLSKNTV